MAGGEGGWRGAAHSSLAGLTPACPPGTGGDRPLALAPMGSTRLASRLQLTRIPSVRNTWTSLKKKSMRFGLSASFFKNLIFQLQIIEAPF